MTATVTSVGEKIGVNVIEAPYGNSGPFWVITSGNTEFIDESGNSVSKCDIKVGNTVEITYGGQVMMSYPPQIVAYAVKILKSE
jgi:hypothetical protein